MSRLEEFIKNNRKRLDELDPPAGLWGRIETGLNDKQKKARIVKLRSVISIAAVLLVVAAGGLILLRHTQKQAIDLNAINADLARQQVRYISVIENKQSQLNRIKQQEPELYREFSMVMDTVEQNYQQLKNSLRTSPNQEETLRAMVLNLQVQMEVLNRQLSVIQFLNKSKDEDQNETQKL